MVRKLKPHNSYFIIHNSGKSGGFTLVELLIVMSLISVLVTIGIVSFRGSQLRARDTQRKADLKQYQNALEVYANRKNGLYPHRLSLVNISVLCTDLGTATSACPDDPRPTTANVHYQYVSRGGSGVPGSGTATSYVLYTLFEGADERWAVCSEGKSGTILSTAPQTTNCPI